jgi:hypothetical protein
MTRVLASDISSHNPPLIRAALVRAAAARDYKEIDRITDLAVRDYPELFVARKVARPEFAARDRLTRSAWEDLKNRL